MGEPIVYEVEAEFLDKIYLALKDARDRLGNGVALIQHCIRQIEEKTRMYED